VAGRHPYGVVGIPTEEPNEPAPGARINSLSLVVVHDESHRIGPGSAPFAERVTGAFIDREERAGQGASDHAPVVVELD
jgi:hypothetical protein